MEIISRRAALQLMASAPVAAGMAWTPAEAEQAHEHAQQARQQAAKQGEPFEPRFFSSHEYETVRVLVDLIIPKDERSGGATDGGVPEFMDFMMIDDPKRQTAMRGGLALIDHVAATRFDKPFTACSDAERRQILDDIAFTATAKTKPELSQAIAFFSSFRDLTASGFWSSKMGVEDLQYQGNEFVPHWTGCPQEALDKLGVKYDA